MSVTGGLLLSLLLPHLRILTCVKLFTDADLRLRLSQEGPEQPWWGWELHDL